MKTSFRTFVGALSGLALMASTAVAATMDYLGAWSATATYATGKVVVYNRAIYYSLRSTTATPNRNRLRQSRGGSAPLVTRFIAAYRRQRTRLEMWVTTILIRPTTGSSDPRMLSVAGRQAQ